MRKLVIGILAHVDAGKTTLAESILFRTGSIRKMGRVDHKDAFLDTYELDRARGITIFSKQAVFKIKDLEVTLLDTPGHVDFSAEMERTLQVLDYAILVISGKDGVQGHTETLWRLLAKYNIPTFIFVNKMDITGTDRSTILNELKKRLNDGCVDFSEDQDKGVFYENLAMCDEELLDKYMESGIVEIKSVSELIGQRTIFPCYFGSALKLDGVDAFLNGLEQYTKQPVYPEQFGAKVYKIARDAQGTRLTYMKVTGGSLKVKMLLTNKKASNGMVDEQSKEGKNEFEISKTDNDTEIWEEKIDQIRIYSGTKFETADSVEAGTVCAVTGLSKTYPGEGLGTEAGSDIPVLKPVLNYQVLLPEGYDAYNTLAKLRQLEEEDPQLHIVWNEQLKEIHIQLMGEVQTEVLKSIIKERFDIDVEFSSGSIVYKETILEPVIGMGHFEPLRHYAEVHLLMEPGEPGSGLVFATACSEDVLDRNWQHLILTHLKEKEHVGVLTGSPITDMKITLIAGRAHQKHTEGGDFRQATYRAVRQGLKKSKSILLEPYYNFRLEIPSETVGRAMTDIKRMYGDFNPPLIDGGMSVITGSAPVVTMRGYQTEVTSYTKGRGRIFCTLKGYEPCHNSDEVIEAIGYDSERDIENPTGSVFCSRGTSFMVEWDKVHKYMHIQGYLEKIDGSSENTYSNQALHKEEEWISPEEIDKIINSTYFANQGRKSAWKKRKTAREIFNESAKPVSKQKESREEYLLVDGYNIIYAWPELKKLADENMEDARVKLLDYLSNYQGIRKCHIIVVFDAYRLQGHAEEVIDYHNIHVVYTREAQTADQYIERFAHTNQRKYDITVATSDGLQQIIIRGAGCALLSARELKAEVEEANSRMKQEYRELQGRDRNYLADTLTHTEKQQMEKIIKEYDN